MYKFSVVWSFENSNNIEMRQKNSAYTTQAVQLLTHIYAFRFIFILYNSQNDTERERERREIKIEQTTKRKITMSAKQTRKKKWKNE